jgi:translation initiation factor IF-2
MSLIRINDLARELRVKSKWILDTLPLVGILEKKSHSSSLQEEEVEKIRVYYWGQSPSRFLTPYSEEDKTETGLGYVPPLTDARKAFSAWQRENGPAPPPVLAQAPANPHNASSWVTMPQNNRRPYSGPPVAALRPTSSAREGGVMPTSSRVNVQPAPVEETTS